MLAAFQADSADAYIFWIGGTFPDPRRGDYQIFLCQAQPMYPLRTWFEMYARKDAFTLNLGVRVPFTFNTSLRTPGSGITMRP